MTSQDKIVIDYYLIYCVTIVNPVLEKNGELIV